MNLFRLFVVLVLGLFALDGLEAQNTDNKQDLVQVTGVVMNVDSMNAVFYCNIGIIGSHRGTISDLDGYFSIIVEKGDTIGFSAVGFISAYLRVPEDLTGDTYSVLQLMETDTINLPESIIYPWPSPEEFEAEFLALDLEDDYHTKFHKAVGPLPGLDYIPPMAVNPGGVSYVISGPFSKLVDFIQAHDDRRLDRYRKAIGILDSVKVAQEELREEN